MPEDETLQVTQEPLSHSPSDALLRLNNISFFTRRKYVPNRRQLSELCHAVDVIFAQDSRALPKAVERANVG